MGSPPYTGHHTATEVILLVLQVLVVVTIARVSHSCLLLAVHPHQHPRCSSSVTRWPTVYQVLRRVPMMMTVMTMITVAMMVMVVLLVVVLVVQLELTVP